MTLPLRDVHAAIAPPWWPPAPGWWLLAALGLGLGALGCWWLRRRHHRLYQRRRAIEALFDDAVNAAATPAAKVAVMSELLRRASRRVDPQADRLAGMPWRRLLDEGLSSPGFLEGAGALIEDGGFRAEVDADAAEALRLLARARFLDWMQRK